MSQLDLFQPSAPAPKPAPKLNGVVLRDYQAAAVEGVFKEWEEHDSTLVCLPTGCGKSVVFSAVMKRWVEEKSCNGS